MITPVPFRKFIRPFIRSIYSIAFLFIVPNTTAQVGIGINPPDNSAILHVQDTAHGLLIPRMTEIQVRSINNPAKGLMVYQTNGTDGFYYYNGNAWVNMVQDNKGAPVVILTDDITDQQAQIKINTEAGPFTREIIIMGCTNLTVIDLSKITELTNLVINNNPVLETVKLHNLVYVIGGEIGISIKQNPNLATLELPSLKKVETYNSITPAGIILSDTKITNLNFPSLEKATQLQITENHLATTLSMPLLQSCAGYSFIAGHPLLSNLTLPNLTTVSQFLIRRNDTLTSVSLPLLTTILNVVSGNFKIDNNRNLSTINLIPFTTANCQEYIFTGNKLSSTAVNGILHVLAISPVIINKTISLSLQTPPAPPTGQGITDKATLSSRGNSVTTD